ncbi:MAG: hypothetical protein ABJB66_18895 [Gemmatimonadaceae bacterium]
MTPDVITTLRAALADRYRIERELGAGGMAAEPKCLKRGDNWRARCQARRGSGP